MPNPFDVDPSRLDEEWVKQAELYHQHALDLAEAHYELDKAKSELELVEAELDRSIRLHPEKHKIEKVTEGSVAKAIILHPSYQEAAKTVIECKHKVGVLTAATSALDHKKRALEKLVDLHIYQYTSEPKVKGATREHAEEMTKSNTRIPIDYRNRRKKALTIQEERDQ